MKMTKQNTLIRSSSRCLLTFSALTGLLLVLASPGCGSLSGPGSASFASVTIKNHSAQEIADACSKVFGADGYRGGVSERPGPDGLREGSVARHILFPRRSRGYVLRRANDQSCAGGDCSPERWLKSVAMQGLHGHWWKRPLLPKRGAPRQPSQRALQVVAQQGEQAIEVNRQPFSKRGAPVLRTSASNRWN
jgi:hypothetical protein